MNYDDIILKTLSAPEAKSILKKTMEEPIKISKEYQAIAKKILMANELPQGTLTRYERDINVDYFGKSQQKQKGFEKYKKKLKELNEILDKKHIDISIL